MGCFQRPIFRLSSARPRCERVAEVLRRTVNVESLPWLWPRPCCFRDRCRECHDSLTTHPKLAAPTFPSDKVYRGHDRGVIRGRVPSSPRLKELGAPVEECQPLTTSEGFSRPSRVARPVVPLHGAGRASPQENGPQIDAEGRSWLGWGYSSPRRGFHPGHY